MKPPDRGIPNHHQFTPSNLSMPLHPPNYFLSEVLKAFNPILGAANPNVKNQEMTFWKRSEHLGLRSGAYGQTYPRSGVFYGKRNVKNLLLMTSLSSSSE
jgi:hypothetical protein